MTQIVTAIYENGVLRPEAELRFPPGTRLRLVVDECDSIGEAREEFERLCDEAPLDTGGVRLTRDQLHDRR